ncbi:hypothetical protein LEP1GSC052_0753 [Leptospira kmetyi serovar Malaysia str. Bejo-Iso9]|nr:hypothetical protein LEP1GSC052_0753 [Leptospira kmetyi serovar Malaysia str. Bejo-Iso9]
MGEVRHFSISENPPSSKAKSYERICRSSHNSKNVVAFQQDDVSTNHFV